MSTIPSTTLRSNFQPRDTGRSVVFQPLLFIGRNVVRWRVGYHRFQRQLGTNRDFGPLDGRVFRGVPPPASSSAPHPPSRRPDLSPPPPSPPHSPVLPSPSSPPLVTPLISGLRGSRNEPSEARWHEEGRGGWVVAGRELFKITLSRPRNAYTPLRHPRFLSCDSAVPMPYPSHRG